MAIPLLAAGGAFVGAGVVWAVTKILTSLGLGVLTFYAIQEGYDLILAYITSAYAGLPADVLQIFGLYGVHQALGIVLGAMAVRVSLIVLGKIGRVV